MPKPLATRPVLFVAAAVALLAAGLPTPALAEAPRPAPLFQVVAHSDRPLDTQPPRDQLAALRLAFQQAFPAPRWHTTPPRHPLTCLLFDDFDRLADYARQADGLALGWNAYYSARTNRIAALADPNLLATPTLDDPADSPSHFTNHAAALAHEAAHQLAFNLGLQRRDRPYPLWLSEGLATALEHHDHPHARSPLDNPDRRAAASRLRNRRALLPLDRLVTRLTPPRPGSPESVAFYNQAWSLFHHLYHRQPDGLSKLFDAHRRNLLRTPEQVRDAFIDCLGPIADVQARWLADDNAWDALPLDDALLADASTSPTKKRAPENRRPLD